MGFESEIVSRFSGNCDVILSASLRRSVSPLGAYVSMAWHSLCGRDVGLVELPSRHRGEGGGRMQ